MPTDSDHDEFRRAIYEISEAIAPTWERRRGFVETVVTPVREWMLREVAPQSGQTVLELGAGTGDTGFEAAVAVGAQGSLISTDFSPAMLDTARRRGAELGVENVEYRVVDAERMELDTDSVDGVLCRFAYMLMADPEAALAETRRVLRAGGRLALAVWGGGPARNPFFTTVVMALVARGHLPPPDPDAPGIFSMADAEQVRAMLEGAGFATTRTEEVAVYFNVRDVEEYLAVTSDTAGPVGLAVQALPEAERDAIKAQLEASIEGFAVQDGYEFPGVALCAGAS